MSQYVAYLDGRLEEVALDRYAQAVFEEVKVKTVGKTAPGPIGPVEGAMVARELHSDGTTEDKIFAPSYGEFRTSGGGDLEALALAGPSNAGTEPLPAELRSLSTGAIAIFELVRLKDWNTVSSTLAHMNGAWRAQRTTNQPRLVAARLDDALHELAQAAQKHAPARTAQAAIDVAQSTLDLHLRYRSRIEIDQARFRLWTQQVRVDAAVGDLARVTGDIAVLEWVRDRFADLLQPADRRTSMLGWAHSEWRRMSRTSHPLPITRHDSPRVCASTARG
jgi:hypothetical protein